MTKHIKNPIDWDSTSIQCLNLESTFLNIQNAFLKKNFITESLFHLPQTGFLDFPSFSTTLTLHKHNWIFSQTPFIWVWTSCDQQQRVIYFFMSSWIIFSTQTMFNKYWINEILCSLFLPRNKFGLSKNGWAERKMQFKNAFFFFFYHELHARLTLSWLSLPNFFFLSRVSQSQHCRLFWAWVVLRCGASLFQYRLSSTTLGLIH